MIALAYWNVQKGKGKSGIIANAIADLAEAMCVDKTLSGPNQEVLLCLSEPGKIDFDSILADLQSRNTGKTWWLKRSFKRFAVLGTLSETEWQPDSLLDEGSLPSTLVRTTTGTPVNYELWFVHLPAPIFVWQPGAISAEAARLLRSGIEARENRLLHTRSIAIGDFNMEPFSEPMVTPAYLNASSCKTIAAKIFKAVGHGKQIRYFFNPMWPLLGTWKNNRQPGSFYQNDKSVSTHWHLIDQVLLRPDLVDVINDGTPVILSNAGSTPLTTSDGAIASVSDHLPVLVTLNI